MSKKETKPATKAAKNEAPKKAAPLEPDVLPPETPKTATTAHALIVRPGDESALKAIELSIQRDIQIGKRFEKGAAFASIKIGMGLLNAKKLLGNGNYGRWVEMKFGKQMCARSLYYSLRLAQTFVNDAANKQLALPAPRDSGEWLAVTDEGSQLALAVDAFVGDNTLSELYDKHGIRSKKEKGGFKPSQTMVDQFILDGHKNLAGKPYEMWDNETQQAFREWYDKQIEVDPKARNVENATAAWFSIRNQITNNAITNKTWAYLSETDLSETADTLARVAAEMKKALKK